MKIWALLAVLALPVSPVLAQSAATDTTAKCKDGSYSTAQSRQGACSAHGGLAQWMGRTSNPTRASARAKAPEGATALCKDGSYSESTTRKGACSTHGGVSEWFPKRAARKNGTASTTRSSDNGTSSNRSTDNGQRNTARRNGGPNAPADATARCTDGTYSESQHREGTCSSHGGVAEWLKDIPKE